MNKLEELKGEELKQEEDLDRGDDNPIKRQQ
jgi:hypothetical protein